VGIRSSLALGGLLQENLQAMFDRLIAYLDSVQARDPSPRSRWEVLIYPGVWALGLHRVAHWLFEAELFFLARLVNHTSRWITGIDIHPGAKIGRNFFIDHGFTVIGETAEIGNNVTIYQCVTLGGTNPTNGIPGKRHPTLRDNVIVGSGAQILGPITVGERARIGAGAVVTDDVPEGATMVGLKARSTLVPAETYVREFIPYGTPCEEPCEPTTQRIDELEARLAQLHAELEKMRPAASGPLPKPSPAKSRKRSGSHS
jgi:serine O-acetyltransferase